MISLIIKSANNNKEVAEFKLAGDFVEDYAELDNIPREIENQLYDLGFVYSNIILQLESTLGEILILKDTKFDDV